MKTIAQLAECVAGQIKGDARCEIKRIASLVSARPGDISFLDNPKFYKHVAKTKASAVILKPQFADVCPTNAIIVDQPYLAYAKIAALFQRCPNTKPGIAASAVIAKSANIDPQTTIGEFCVIGERVQIAAGVVVGAHCVIDDDCVIGADSILDARVTLYPDVRIGINCRIHSGAVLGADGFGLAQEINSEDKGYQWLPIPQLGGVRVGNRVRVGANTTIDRGALDNTVIGNDVHIDNLVQIAHNVVIGDHCAIAGCVGISGSTRLGKRCIVGGGAGLAGHLNITDNVIITGATSVSRSISQPGMYSSGTTAKPYRLWRKNQARFHQLDDMAKRIKALEKQENHDS